MELAQMYADFERWMPGVFENTPLAMESGKNYAVVYVASLDPEDEMVYAVNKHNKAAMVFAAALIESAVLDELERREIGVDLMRGSPMAIELTSGPVGDWQNHIGTGPTRLHRLHAACKAAFGDDATNGREANRGK